MKQERSTKGFTLIELIVIMAILVLISTFLLASNTRFGGVILLRNLTYEVGLSIRKAQVYGIAVRRFGEAEFGAGYGVHFNSSEPTTYVLFADVYPSEVGNGLYDPGQGEIAETLGIQLGFRIVDLCATPAGGTESCGLDTLDILFRRPEPDAFISKDGVSGVENQAALQERGRIILESPRGNQASVIVEASGQIAVQ